MNDVTSKDIMVANIRREMRARKITQIDLAKKCGWSQARLAEVLTSEHIPRLDTLDVIATALEVQSCALLMPVPENLSVLS